MKNIWKKTTQKIKNPKEKQKWKHEKKKKNMKGGSHPNGPLLALPPLSTEPPKSNLQKRKSSFLNEELLNDFFPVLASARTTEKTR